MRTWLKRSLIGVATSSVLGFGLIGFAHTSAGKPLLGWLKGAPGCPVETANVNPVAIEDYRTRTLQSNLSKATTDARSTPALSFSLGQSTRDDVTRFAAKNGASCSEQAKGAALRCTGFAPAKAGADAQPADLYAQFSPDGSLVAVDVFRDVEPEAGIALLSATADRLTQHVGPMTRRSGPKPDAERLKQPFARSALEFQYKNYSAKLSIMNFGKDRYRLREQYQWLAPAALAAR